MKKMKSEKVRKIYDIGSNKLMLVTNNIVMGLDNKTLKTFYYKGELINRLSAFWFDFTKNIIPNNMVSIERKDFPAICTSKATDSFISRSMIVKKLKMLPIECIVAGYDKKNKEFLNYPTCIFTKKSEYCDDKISYEQAVKLIGEKYSEQIKNKSIELYRKCSEYALEKGIIIANIKLRYGIDDNGRLTIANELITPNTSHFFLYTDQYMSPNEECSNFAENYVNIFERITGTDF